MGKKILHNGQNIQTKSILPIQIPVYANYAYEKKERKKISCEYNKILFTGILVY